MVRLRPFKAIRPDRKFIDKVAALPYDTMDVEEARKMSNPYSYLRIDRAEIDLEKGVDPYSEEVYREAAKNLECFIDVGVLLEDDEEALYLYREIMDEHEQVGIVGCVSVKDYEEKKIRIHEHTKPDKVEDRLNHIRYCKANTGTILLTYKDDEEAQKIMDDTMEKKPLYDFVSEDGIRHTVWKMDKVKSQEMVEVFGGIDILYIADGHHRAKAAVEYSKESTGEEKDYFLAMITPKSNLYIMDYNRVVRDLNGLSEEEFLEKAGENFEIEEGSPKPSKKFDYGMYLDGRWYRLRFKGEVEGIVDSLDVEVLDKYLIRPILNILDPRRDPRIDYIGGIRGIEGIEDRVDKDMKVGFLLYPTSIDELIEVADNELIMPAKSTWVEPKVRCGIFIHKIK